MKKIQDERVVAGKRKINSYAFSICFLGLWGIILYRQFILKQAPSEYRDIFFLAMGISIYVSFGNIMNGFYYTYANKATKKKMMIIGPLVGAIALTTTQVLVKRYDITNAKDILEIIISSIGFFSVWMIAQFIMFKVSDKQANKDIE